MTPVRCNTCGTTLATVTPDDRQLVINAAFIRHKVTIECRFCQQQAVTRAVTPVCHDVWTSGEN
jgi:uncharacterized protein with PIN domain